ncbi:MAG: peptidoglycan DD-metalloendopeptidase family protein [Gallionella sp.]|nr:peptidoglycan DD-metalloendopeptidase family protein [Gallionella sp.]
MTHQRCVSYLLAAAILSACSSAYQPSGVGAVSRPGAATTESTRMKGAGEKDWRPATHQVVKGDTMYSIAFYYGLDYHELAELNGIKDPRVIQVGQVLRLFPSAKTAPVADTKPAESVPKDQPKVVKYVYNDAAMAKIDQVQNQTTTTYAVEGATIEVTPLGRKADVAAANPKAEAAPPADSPIINTEEDALQWSMPTTGKIIARFSEAANRKGIDIAGTLGQSIVASAPGKVVYSGSGLRGYGKLIIIKHNKTYLSAYAHNDKVLVKEGQSVKRGEKIAEMGKTDADQVKLHFEVRRLGKPVDPAKYLPKS